MPVKMKKKSKKKVFLDTNVILCYLNGDPSCTDLFDRNIKHNYQFFINPVVMQEVLHVTGFSRMDNKIKAEDVEKILSKLKILEFANEKDIRDIATLTKLKNGFVHANDFLNISSAMKECEYFVTLDNQLLKLDTLGNTKLLTPSKLLSSEV